MEYREKDPRSRDPGSPLEANSAYGKIAPWLANVKFRKKLLGGVDPEDVWKKLEELNTLYENALLAERARYDLLLQQLSGRENQGESADA